MRHAEALDALECFEREASPELLARVPGLSDMKSALSAHVGQVIFVGEKHSARLSVNGRPLGNLKLETPYRVDSGNVAIRVEAEGFVTIEQTVFLAPQTDETVSLLWKRVELSGTITFKATVPAAVLYVDDEKRGQTPIELSLAPGRHSVKLTHPDYDPLDSEINVVAKERREVTLALHEKPPIWAKWWFWTGAAVIVAGAVATGIVLNSEKSPKAGDIEPGIVSAPLITRF
ncbi:MAG: PEGA domain-containing protein [Polyangiaceae bacterium]